jgi:iron complex transport system substrate-binding protein
MTASAAAISARGVAAQDGTATPAASPVAAGTWPRDVNDLFGPVTIPAAPQRVVALSDWYEVDYLLAVGIQPVLYGYTNRYGQGIAPWVIETAARACPPTTSKAPLSPISRRFPPRLRT